MEPLLLLLVGRGGLHARAAAPQHAQQAGQLDVQALQQQQLLVTRQRFDVAL